MARRQFPIGEQDFANIRNRNMVYIDKTHLIYKFESGTPTALVETMQRNDYSLEHLTNEEVSSQLMSSVDSDEVSPIPLIYQSGYLTIKGYDEEFGNYLLGFPNKEVCEGFTRSNSTSRSSGSGENLRMLCAYRFTSPSSPTASLPSSSTTSRLAGQCSRSCVSLASLRSPRTASKTVITIFAKLLDKITYALLIWERR